MALDIYNSLPIHRAMLADAPRNAAFQLAIAALVRPRDVVLDVGAGTGVLAMMAARAGAARVFAVEPSPVAQIAAVNAHRHAGQIIVMRDTIENVVLPELADVIVSEWLGAFGIDENLLPMVLVARDRWLKPGGRLVPATVTALAMPVDAGGAASALPCRTWKQELLWAAAGVPAHAALASAQAMWMTDTLRVTLAEAALPARAHLRFPIARAARLGGFVVWFEADLGAGVRLANASGGPPTHWGQFVFSCPGQPEVAAGDLVDFSLATIPAGAGWCDHAWTISVGGRTFSCDTRGRRSAVRV